MNGLIIVNKPPNLTSRDVVNRLNKIWHTKKIGHTGTLDPLATGVLVCLVGKYTKLVNTITSLDKEYIAEVRMGITTDTLDITGQVLNQKEPKLTQDELIKCLQSFVKEYEQTVPLYSAVKINGKKLYEYARNKEEIILPKRKVKIYSLELLEFNNETFKFKTRVSKGTYIRSLIKDICDSLNIYGTMQSLVRTKQGSFSLNESFTLEDIMNNNYKLLQVDEFLDYPKVLLNQEEYLKVKNGHPILNKNNYLDKVLCIYENKVIAIYQKKDDYLVNYLML